MSLKKKTLWGILWTGIGKMGMQGIQVLVTAVLARVLSKGDYGLANLATLVTSAIIIVNETGLGTAIVMQKEVSKRQLSSVFWGSIGFGVLLFLVFASAAKPLAMVLKNPAVRPILLVQSLGFVIGSFGVVPRALMAKEMNFKPLSMIELSAATLSGVLAISLALAGMGPWSIVCSVLFRDAVIAVLVWYGSHWWPMRHFAWPEFRSIFGFSAQVLANDVALYMNTNSDISLVSRYMGSAAVASYGNLLNLVKLPVSRLSQIVSKVAFPAFARVQDDLAAFRRGYVQAIAGISSLTFPMLIGLGIFSREVVIVLFSSKYEDMVQPLMILVPYAMLKSVVTIKGSVLIARRRPGIELTWNVAYILPFAIAIYYGAHYGLVGVACAFAGLYLLTFPIIQTITNRQVNLTNRDFFTALWPAFASSMVMLAAGLFYKYVLSLLGPVPVLVTLMLGVPLVGSFYLLAMWFMFRRQTNELVQLWSLVKKTKRQSGNSMEVDAI